MLYFQPHEQEGHMYVDWAYLGNLGLWIVVCGFCVPWLGGLLVVRCVEHLKQR